MQLEHIYNPNPCGAKGGGWEDCELEVSYTERLCP